MTGLTGGVGVLKTFNPSVLHSHFSASDVSAHQSILRHCGEPASLYIEKNHLVVISPSHEVIHVVGLLEDMHIRMLRQKYNIIRYIAQTKKSQEVRSGLRFVFIH